MNQFGQNFRYETREQTAFRWSVEELFEHSKRVYLWTFTLVKVMPSWWIGPTWAKLQDFIRKTYSPVQGLRVFEWHRDHGLHVHMLTNRRMSVGLLRWYAKKLGFGRINVKVCKNAGAGKYLAKYLGKDRGKIPHLGRSFARFGRLGCAKSAIEYRTADLTERKRIAAGLRLNGMEPYTALLTAKRMQEDAFEQEAWASYRAAVPNPF
jgi:hypothetical protein